MTINEKRNRSIILIIIGMMLLISTVTSLLFALNVFKSKKVDNKINILSNPISVTIRFDNNGGYGGQKNNITAIYGRRMPKLSSLIPTKKGYTFIGWYDNTDYNKGTKYYDKDGIGVRVLNHSKTFTLYAGWEKDTYLKGNALIQFKEDNNINIDSNILISKHSITIRGNTLDYYLVYNKDTFTESDYNKFLQYVDNSFNYISKVNSKIISNINKDGFDIIFLGHYDCDNNDKEVGKSTFAVHSNNRNMVISYDDNYFNNPYYEGLIINEIESLYENVNKY